MLAADKISGNLKVHGTVHLGQLIIAHDVDLQDTIFEDSFICDQSEVKGSFICGTAKFLKGFFGGKGTFQSLFDCGKAVFNAEFAPAPSVSNFKGDFPGLDYVGDSFNSGAAKFLKGIKCNEAIFKGKVVIEKPEDQSVFCIGRDKN
jgi:hypothetical protein